MSGGINTHKAVSCRGHREGGGEGQNDPVTAILHLHSPLPLLAGPALSLPTSHWAQADPSAPTTTTNPPAHPLVVSSLPKTARLHYLSVTMLLFGNHERGCGDVDAKPPCTWFLSGAWMERKGGKRQRWEKEGERDWAATRGWDREENNVKGSLWEMKSSYYLFRSGQTYVRRNDAALGQKHFLFIIIGWKIWSKWWESKHQLSTVHRCRWRNSPRILSWLLSNLPRTKSNLSSCIYCPLSFMFPSLLLPLCILSPVLVSLVSQGQEVILIWSRVGAD